MRQFVCEGFCARAPWQQTQGFYFYGATVTFSAFPLWQTIYFWSYISSSQRHWLNMNLSPSSCEGGKHLVQIFTRTHGPNSGIRFPPLFPSNPMKSKPRPFVPDSAGGSSINLIHIVNLLRMWWCLKRRQMTHFPPVSLPQTCFVLVTRHSWTLISIRRFFSWHYPRWHGPLLIQNNAGFQIFHLKFTPI